MMEYTGKYKKMHSKQLGKDVYVLEYRSKDKYPWCECDRCGKMITRRMYTIQDAETDIIQMNLGSECFKHFE